MAWRGMAGLGREDWARAMGQHLERVVRAYIAEGTGLESNLVRPGNAKGPRPKDPYATLLLQNDQRRSYPEHRGLCNTAGIFTGTLQVEPRRATYSLQFYRDGAVDLAEAFDRWAQSEIGLIQAQTSFASGGGAVRHIRVIQGGSGYTAAPAVTIVAPPSRKDGTANTQATATASVVAGAVSGIALDTPGTGYVDVLQADWESSGVTIDPPPSGETATASAIGWGHVIEFPLNIRRLDTILGDQFEERAVVDLAVSYTHWNVDDVSATGATTEWDWELFGGC